MIKMASPSLLVNSFFLSDQKILLGNRDSLTNPWTHGDLLFPLIMKFGQHGQYGFEEASIMSLHQAFLFFSFAALIFIR